jgi:biotin synthase-like enzyme
VNAPLDDMAQAVRKAHCAADEKRNHECVGTLFVDRGGCKLDCKLCGGLAVESKENPEEAAIRRAKAVVEAAGLNWEKLSEEARRDAITAIRWPWKHTR